jgi:hypothetical protein
VGSLPDVLYDVELALAEVCQYPTKANERQQSALLKLRELRAHLPGVLGAPEE